MISMMRMLQTVRDAERMTSSVDQDDRAEDFDDLVDSESSAGAKTEEPLPILWWLPPRR